MDGPVTSHNTASTKLITTVKTEYHANTVLKLTPHFMYSSSNNSHIHWEFGGGRSAVEVSGEHRSQTHHTSVTKCGDTSDD